MWVEVRGGGQSDDLGLYFGAKVASAFEEIHGSSKSFSIPQNDWQA